MTEIIIAVIGSGLLSTIITSIISYKKESNKKESGVNNGVRALLYDKIKYLGKHHISNGEISAEDLEDLISLHNVYHNDLGGNGYLDEIMRNVRGLKIKV